MKRPVWSWGNVCGGEHEIVSVKSRDEVPPLNQSPSKVLPFGTGRSYGDSCLNVDETLIDTRWLDHFISMDPATGILRCESGVSLEKILRWVVPQGFFLPVSLGTKLITVGGAIANDIHGKNHHRAGTFGRHVRKFELLRSDGERKICSADENSELFRATIGGLGLTGLILWAEISLPRIPSSFLNVEMVRFRNLEEYFDLAQESDAGFEHTSAWTDFMGGERSFGRGIFLRGNFIEVEGPQRFRAHDSAWTVPFTAPNWLLNRPGLRLFNAMYFRRVKSGRTHYDPFFFPLDILDQWNRLYGKRGFFQYQFVLPSNSAKAGMEKIRKRLLGSNVRPFLAVLKSFGSKFSPGILSFPMEGLTVALDFPNLGEKTLTLFRMLDEEVREHQGRLYPAKDARMGSKEFEVFFPHWMELQRHLDPKFSSTFWRRVTGGNHA